MHWLKNSTVEDTEFEFGGKVFVVPAGQKIGVDVAVAKHYKGYVNGPLEVVTDGEPTVRIANTTKEDKTFKGVTIPANSEIELSKVKAKEFIRAVDGVFWATGKKKVSDRVGERGDI